MSWWRRLPKATFPNDTDVCSPCGHVRWRHEEQRIQDLTGRKEYESFRVCTVLGCDCSEQVNLKWPYHRAGYVSPNDTVEGKQINQPARPGKPIPT